MIDADPGPCPASDDLDEVLDSPDWEELEARTLRALGSHGFGGFMLKMEIAPPGGIPATHLFGSLPAALHESYRAAAESEGDPVRPHIDRSALPYAWRPNQFCRPGGGPLYPALLEAGVGDGVSLKVRGGHAISRIDFYREEGAVLAPPRSMRAGALLYAVLLHEAAETLWLRSARNCKPLLSGREIECLGWSAHGKTCAEVGLILRISERTVHFHLKNAAAKLEVRSTRHAIARAYALGIFKPGR
jgi:DNA-binding CsgD family transcriptional regulator